MSEMKTRVDSVIRDSSAPYLSALVLTMMLSAWANYLKDRIDPTGFSLFGQSPGIYLSFFLFPVPALLWAAYRGGRPRNAWALVFLGGLAVSWVVHFALIHVHDDPYIHPVWLFIPILAMIAWKPPTSREAWAALRVMAWAVGGILVATMVLEKLGAVPEFLIPDHDSTAWELKHYWLPLREIFGLEGRWPGPFGFNSKTGFMSVFIVTFALADRRKAGWVLAVIGVCGILLTGGRGVYLSILAGVAVLILFTTRGPIARIPVWIRAGFGLLAVVAAGLAFFFSPISTTGRIGDNGIWNSFLDLWRTSIWNGVGQQGIWNSTGRAHEAMDAHSIYVQELAKFGLIGFALIFAVLLVGYVMVVRAALLGWAGPMALLTIYLVAGVTDLLHDGWQSHSTYSIMVILCVMGASAWTLERRRSGDRGALDSGAVMSE